jgi:Zn-dependent peptidase ImmA (M78 family)
MTRSAYELRQDAETAASEVLASQGLTDLWDMPIDVTRVAENWGAEVYVDDLDDEDLDGFVLIGPGHAEITVNRNRALNRRRFTIAHELGHAVQHHQENRVEAIGYVDDSRTLKRRDLDSQSGTVADEVYANAFAAALLMPRELVHALRGAGQNAWQMAQFFKVSEAAMRYRLENLGLGAA